MAYEKFREKHGGLGPAQLVSQILGGKYGLFGQLGAEEQRTGFENSMSAIANDDSLTPELRSTAVEAQAQRLSRDQMQKIQDGIEARARTEQAINGGFQTFDAQHSKLEASAVTPDDSEQLGIMRTQADYAKKMMLSLNPDLQKEGYAIMAGVLNNQRQYGATNEQQAIEAATLKASTGEAADKLRYERDAQMSTALSERLKPLDEQLDNLGVALALNNDPKADNIQRQLAFNNVITALDPGGRRDPDGRYAGANGIAVQLQNAYDRALGQKDQDAFKATNEIIRAAAAQIQKNRDRAVITARKQAAAYGGDSARVLSVVPERTPFDVIAAGGADRITDSSTVSNGPASPAGEPNPLEQLAAAGKAGLEVANANIPDTVKAAGGTVAALSGSKIGWSLLQRFAPAAAPLAAPAALGAAQGLAMGIGSRRIPGEPPIPQGDVNGTYVPPFLRRAFPRVFPQRVSRNTDEVQ